MYFNLKSGTENIVNSPIYTTVKTQTYIKNIFCDIVKDNEKAWNEIKSAYLPRPYHNLEHIAGVFYITNKCLEDEAYAISSEELQALKLAIIIHDFYQGENAEEKSADKLTEFAVPEKLKSLASIYIMATKHLDEGGGHNIGNPRTNTA